MKPASSTNTLTQVTTFRVGTSFTISILGRFDFDCHQAFRRAYEQILPSDDIAVDLSQTEYLDSAALGMLLILKEHAGNRRIRIRACRAPVKRILEIANFDRIFPLEE